MPAICVTEPKYICPIAPNKLHITYLPSAIAVAGITWLSLIRDVPVVMQVDLPLADKWGHMIAYRVLALCLAGDSYRARLSARTTYILALLPPLAYGGLMEWMQLYCPPRSCELLDWIADGIGTIAGVALFALCHILTNRKTKHLSSQQ
jgi:VanZ family protein